MSNKKRISKKVKAIHHKIAMKRFMLGCRIMKACIDVALEYKKMIANPGAFYPIDGVVPNDVTKETIIDSHGDIHEFVLPKNSNYNRFKIKDKDYGSATFNIHKPKQS